MNMKRVYVYDFEDLTDEQIKDNNMIKCDDWIISDKSFIDDIEGMTEYEYIESSGMPSYYGYGFKNTYTTTKISCCAIQELLSDTIEEWVNEQDTEDVLSGKITYYTYTDRLFKRVANSLILMDLKLLIDEVEQSSDNIEMIDIDEI